MGSSRHLSGGGGVRKQRVRAVTPAWLRRCRWSPEPLLFLQARNLCAALPCFLAKRLRPMPRGSQRGIRAMLSAGSVHQKRAARRAPLGRNVMADASSNQLSVRNCLRDNWLRMKP